MANGTQVRRVLLQVEADDGDTEEKLDRITAKADELAERHPELKVKIDSAAAAAKLSVLRADLKAVGKDVEPKVDLKIDDAALAKTRAELDALDEKLIQPTIKPTVDDSAAKTDALKAGQDSGSSFASGFGLKGYAITGGIVLALAALPALAAGAGALAGIALGAALLVGTSSVKGPLYAQFHSMLSTLTSVLRVAALPLVKPLGEAFAQIGQWAKELYPELHAVFASLGPLVAPLVKGLEGLVSGILPGFLTLMHAAQPAVAALSGVLSSLSAGLGGLLAQMAPGVRSSSLVLTSLAQILRALMPVVGTLANSLAGALGPALRTFATILRTLAPVAQKLAAELLQLAGAGLNIVLASVEKILPPVAKLAMSLLNGLAPILPPLTKAVAQVAGAMTSQLQRSLTQMLPPLQQITGTLLDLAQKVIVPNLPVIAKLSALFMEVGMQGLIPMMPPLVQVSADLLNMADKVITPLLPLLNTLAGYLGDVAGAATSALTALSSLSTIPGFGFLSGTTAVGTLNPFTGLSAGTFNPFAGGGAGGGGTAAYDAAAASAGADYGSAWANGVTTAVTKTAQKTARPAAANLALILSQGVLAGLEGTASQVRSAVSKLLGAVNTDVSGKYLTTGQGSAISKWLEADQSKLTALADKRAKILATIAQADAYAKNVTSNAESTFGVVSAAGSITPALGVGGIMRQLLGDVAQIRIFRTNIAKLRKMGLNKAYIDQIIQAGPVQGGEIAAELAAGNEGDIRGINKAESQIAQASVSLGQTAANAMFDSGKQAGKGFLSGLESQQKQLEAAMRKLADVLVNTIRKELKIHSPSEVAYDLFKQVPAAGVLAIDDSHTAMTAASVRMARAAVSGSASWGGPGGGRGGTLQLEWVGGSADQALITLLKRHIRVHGGNPAVLGA